MLHDNKHTALYKYALINCLKGASIAHLKEAETLKVLSQIAGTSCSKFQMVSINDPSTFIIHCLNCIFGLYINTYDYNLIFH